MSVRTFSPITPITSPQLLSMALVSQTKESCGFPGE